MGQNEIIMPFGFTLDDYISQGEFDYLIITSHQDIALKIKITRFMSTHLFETSLNKNQHITELENDMYLLVANIKDTDQIRWWIRSFSTHIEVLEPLELRAPICTGSAGFRRNVSMNNNSYRIW